jgi:hypothetical protein
MSPARCRPNPLRGVFMARFQAGACGLAMADARASVGRFDQPAGTGRHLDAAAGGEAAARPLALPLARAAQVMAQCLDHEAEGWRRLTPRGVVEVTAVERRAPILKHAQQSAIGQRRGDLDADHVDLYDNLKKIPFDRLEAFFRKNRA